MNPEYMSRREFCALAAAAATPAAVLAAGREVAVKKIPSSGETVPVIGMGSSNTFDVGASTTVRAPLRDVLRALVAGGSTVIDTSPMYGSSETVLGDLIAELGARPKLWIATKVWTRGRSEGQRQISESMRRLRTDRLELLQIHNLLDWRTHVPTLQRLREEGRIRYVGVTHYRADAHEDVLAVLKAERFDWVQINYSLAEREAEAKLLPWCLEHGVAVMANRPFADSALFARTRDKPLPAWAAEIGCASWAQFFLRFVASHPAVTCTIPATAKPQHMHDNVAAGAAPLPDDKHRARMAEFFATL